MIRFLWLLVIGIPALVVGGAFVGTWLSPSPEDPTESTSGPVSLVALAGNVVPVSLSTLGSPHAVLVVEEVEFPGEYVVLRLPEGSELARSSTLAVEGEPLKLVLGPILLEEGTYEVRGAESGALVATYRVTP